MSGQANGNPRGNTNERQNTSTWRAVPKGGQLIIADRGAADKHPVTSEFDATADDKAFVFLSISVTVAFLLPTLLFHAHRSLAHCFELDIEAFTLLNHHGPSCSADF